MPITFEFVSSIFEQANVLFLREGYHAVVNDVSERNWYGTMKSCLDRVISGTEINQYHTDIEYNRNAGKLKTIVNNHNGIISICCDVIVHSRGENITQDNLIAIEMKKTGATPEDRESDITRLKCLTRDTFDDIWSFDGTTLPEHVCRYLMGVFYEVNIARRTALIQYFRKGELCYEYRCDFTNI